MKQCDLVMKGGISSGIVYPKAVAVLAQKFRFRNIGGTSAGAIAAAFAGAAEYRRQVEQSDAGFEVLENQLPAQIGNDLMSLFQPYPEHKKVFGALMKLVQSKKPSLVKFLFRNFFKIRQFYRLPQSIADTEYGLCPGLTTQNNGVLGLTDWLNQWLEQVAGRLENDQLPSAPLTFGDLKKAEIKLKVITTNVSTQQSVALPFSNTCYAKLKDLKALLPKNVVDYLVNYHHKKSSQVIENDNEFVLLPSGDEMPVLMAVRMSLSFPVLLAAFPIYQPDWSRRKLKPEALAKPRLCWFSDGGISSNFPIHLFDDIFPLRPTFGISLNEFHADRHDADPSSGEPGSNRVFLPTQANEGITVPINPIGGLFSFLGAVFAAAQNWQDKAQTKLPGYRDRVVSIALKADEGGLNLAMNEDQIMMLSELGGLAAEEIIAKFNFDEHRWRRLLSAYAAFEKEFSFIYEEFLTNDSSENLSEYLARYVEGFNNKDLIANSYSPSNQAELDQLISRINELSTLAGQWHANPVRNTWGDNNMPKPNTSLRLVPGAIYDD